jgi:hypothetical protein
MQFLALISALALVSYGSTSNSAARIKDKVSLQWAICDVDPYNVLLKLGEDARDPDKLDPITYYEAKPPVYISKGLMFRTKVRAGQNVSVVKVRLDYQREPAQVPESAECLWDRYGDYLSFVCKKQSDVNETSIWSDEQIAFIENFQSGVFWDGLVGFGPYMNPKWKNLNIKGFKAVFDDVTATSLHLREIETKIHRPDAGRAYLAISDHLRNSGVILCDTQESKTMRLLRGLGYYSTETESSPRHRPGDAQKPLLRN